MDRFNNNDPLKQFVKGKLADYKAKMPPSGWEKLESSLLATQKLKVVRKKWIVSTLSAVAAALIGVFFVFENMKNDIPMNLSEYQTTETESTTKDKAIEEPALKEKEIKTDKSTQSLIANNTSSSRDRDLNSYTRTQDVHTSDAIISDEKTITTAKPIIDEPLQKKNDIDEEKKQQLIQDFINEGKRPLTSSNETKTPKTKNRSRNSISLTGQTGLSGSQQSTSTPITLRSSLSETYGVYALNKMMANNSDEVEIKPESEINHMQPVSFGVLTSFALTRRLQIETGLVYTYLSSETKNQATDYSESEKMQFYYLGVPLNLNYTLLSINKLDMFVSAGAMIEKDISGKMSYNDERKTSSFNNSGYASEKSSKIKQHNPQFSISSGVGITYPIYDKAQVFGKVGGRYYFNANNEYRTYYSDEKFGLDIQMGIKFNF